VASGRGLHIKSKQEIKEAGPCSRKHARKGIVNIFIVLFNSS